LNCPFTVHAKFSSAKIPIISISKNPKFNGNPIECQCQRPWHWRKQV